MSLPGGDRQPISTDIEKSPVAMGTTSLNLNPEYTCNLQSLLSQA
jgi:hypothetical protein